MKTIVRGMLVTVLAIGFGCTRPDWIERTLVTVDVSGTWYGTGTGTVAGGTAAVVWLDLQQEGGKATGSMTTQGFGGGALVSSGRIEGTLAGDVFTFRQMNGPLTGEF